MRDSARTFLLFSVFITGASVLVVEVIATRILAPYFGNTIFTFSSVIGVILAALSIGYYLGGVISDLYPSIKWFFGIIFVSGISLFVLLFFAFFLLPIIGSKFSLIYGPLISSLLLFLIPAVFLGLLSPYAIKLLAMKSSKKDFGKVSGSVFFWSTLGSILGSLLSGFVLIPLFGIQQIIFFTGIILCLLGLLGLVLSKVDKSKWITLFVFLIFFISLIVIFFSGEKTGVLYRGDGLYEKILIFDGERKGKPTRFLKQDTNSSAAMFLDSDELVFDYTKYYVLYELFTNKLDKALILGGGAYSIPKALLNYQSSVQVDVVEIEPSLWDLSKKYFRLIEDYRLTNTVVDGRLFLKNINREYDLIFSDVYSSGLSVPIQFTTKEFFQLVKSRLTPEGVFVGNLFGYLSDETPSFLLSEIKTFRSVFPNSYFFAVVSRESKKLQNVVFLGTNSDLVLDFNDPLITNNYNQIISELEQKHIDIEAFNLSSHSVFTDDFAPIEFYIAAMLKRG